MNAPTWHFHVSRAARERYGFEKSLYSTSGNVIFLDLHAARLFTQRINDWRRAHAGTGAAGRPCGRDRWRDRGRSRSSGRRGRGWGCCRYRGRDAGAARQ